MSTCYAQPNPIFQPAMRIITAITNGNPATVTTSFAHQYISGTLVRLDIPPADGMPEADQFVGPITVTGTTTFTLPLDTTTFTPFAIPVSPLSQINTCAQVVPIGEITPILDAAVQNVLPFKA
ncbi:MAG: hypothetical protein ACHQVS_00535 [Candidatus Babeliales bacterium]